MGGVTCPIYRSLIPQGEQLIRRGSQWVSRSEGSTALQVVLGLPGGSGLGVCAAGQGALTGATGVTLTL